LQPVRTAKFFDQPALNITDFLFAQKEHYRAFYSVPFANSS
jgi:hypothetical protein